MEAWIANVSLKPGLDQIRWHLDPSGIYLVNSMYRKLSQGVIIAHDKDIWKAKVPLKIKIFAWQLVLDKLPSSMQIATCNGPSDGMCALCGAQKMLRVFYFLALLRPLSGVCCALAPIAGVQLAPSKLCLIPSYLV
jgi:hypothetical protein